MPWVKLTELVKHIGYGATAVALAIVTGSWLKRSSRNVRSEAAEMKESGSIENMRDCKEPRSK